MKIEAVKVKAIGTMGRDVLGSIRRLAVARRASEDSSSGAQ